MKTETTTSLYGIIEEDETMDISGNIQIENFSDDMDGIFSRVCDWTRFANKIDNNGISDWFEKNYKYYGIKEINETSYGCYTIVFEKEIKACVFETEKKQIIENIKSMDIEVGYQWFFLTNGRQDKIANGIDIFFSIKKVNY